MFSLLADKLQDIFKDLRGHGKISETNVSDALRAVRMALNQDLCEETAALSEGCEVAFFPPVTGG